MNDSRLRWDTAAPHYLRSSWHANEAALAHMVLVSNVRGGSIVDVATGAGHAAMAFSHSVDRVLALDTSPRMLAIAKEEAGKREIDNIHYVIGDALDLPFLRTSFDGVVCRVAAHHFEDPELFLRRSFDVLKQGGFLLLIDTVGADDPGADEALHLLEILRDPSHVRDYTPSAWRRMARIAGFEIELEDTVQKPLNANEWMDRISVDSATRKKILELIISSKDWFREYLRPHSKGDLLTFHLSECTMLLRK